MKVSMSVAKIISTSFLPRAHREDTQLCGRPLGFFSHAQNFQTRESVIELIELNIREELICDPGEDLDVYFVNNDVGWDIGNSFISKINGTKLKRGHVFVLNKENYGRSFGCYDYAFQKLKDRYNYFIFTEDDILINGDGYASLGVRFFSQIPDCGFLAYQSISNASDGLDLSSEEKRLAHAHGGVGITSNNVLSHVFSKHGYLPHAKKDQSQEFVDIIRFGEIPFTNIIHQLGYRLGTIPSNIKLYEYAYDRMRDITVKRYANLLEVFLYHAKKILYHLLVIRSLNNMLKKIGFFDNA